MGLLLGRAELEDGRGQQEDAVLGDPLRTARPVVLLLEDQPLPAAGGPAAEGLGPGHRGVAGGVEGALPVEVLGEALGGVAREDPVVVALPPRSQLLLEPPAHLGTEGVFLGAPGQVHTAAERI
nr:hypothetical protein [Aquihabitans sp. G128]